MRSIQEKGRITFGQAVRDFFKGYVDFRGVSTRAGYWWIQLLIWIIELIVIMGMTTTLVTHFPFESSLFVNDFFGHSTVDMITSNLGFTSYAFTAWLVVGTIAFLALIIPAVAVSVRRMRDAGLSSAGIIVFVMVYLALFLTDILVDDGPIIHFFWLLCMMTSFVVKLLPTDCLVARGTSRFETFLFRVKK